MVGVSAAVVAHGRAYGLRHCIEVTNEVFNAEFFERLMAFNAAFSLSM